MGKCNRKPFFGVVNTPLDPINWCKISEFNRLGLRLDIKDIFVIRKDSYRVRF